jgi:tagatose-6-phosphate ketose/aldose isomerase
MLHGDVERLSVLAGGAFDSAVFLGSGAALGAAREAALKMLEMSGGRVRTFAESWLGLRHGPMSAVRASTLVVGFLSSDATVRDYELDLLRELRRKGLGAQRVLVGADIPADVLGANDVAIDLPALATLGDADAPLLHVLVGQCLALFRCLHLGLKPDFPAEGVLTRVVEDFAIHRNASA